MVKVFESSCGILSIPKVKKTVYYCEAQFTIEYSLPETEVIIKTVLDNGGNKRFVRSCYDLNFGKSYSFLWSTIPKNYYPPVAVLYEECHDKARKIVVDISKDFDSDSLKKSKFLKYVTPVYLGYKAILSCFSDE